MLVYSINPGDKVIIPSFFASRREGKVLNVSSSGASYLKLKEEVLNLPKGIKVKTLDSGFLKMFIQPGKYLIRLK